jgi:hypothetical protein
MGSSGGGGGGSAVQSTTQWIRYAPYIETRHKNFLDKIYAEREVAVDDSPFSDYVDVDVDDAFFGVGYTISSFPSLFDMYGKFMAGLDIEVLHAQIFEDTVDSPIIGDLIVAEGALLDDEIKTNSLPRLQVGMRDINAVMSSSFVVGKALLEDARTKMISKFSADLKYRLIPVATQRWVAHLDWNKLVIASYAEIIKLYFSAKVDVDEVNYAMAAKNKLWPFTVLDFERAALGALQGASNSKTDVAGASTAAKVLSGAMSGAAMGAMIGSIWNVPASGVAGTSSYVAPSSSGSMYGAGIGAVLGMASAYTY